MSNTYQYRSIQSVATVITSPVNKKTLPNEIPVFLCNYTDIYYNTVITNDMPFMEATATQNEISRFSLKSGDVVITKDSESPDDIGVPAYIKNTKDKLLCGYHLTILRPKDGLDGKFLSYALTESSISYKFYKYANGITRFGLTSNAYQKITIPLPPLSEQKAIANMLGKWDTAIEKTEALIATKQKQFEWLVAQLIQKQNNKPDWEKKRLHEIGKIITGNTPPKNDPNNYGNYYNWATADDFKNKYITNTNIKLSEKGKKLARCVPIDSVLVSCIGSIGLNAIAKVSLATNQQINAIIPNKDQDTDFIYYLISSGRNQLIKFAGHGGILMLSKGAFAKIEFFLPPLAEQKRIAQILNTAQKEIDTLKSLAEQYRTQKRGLMQKLLTGQWRIAK